MGGLSLRRKNRDFGDLWDPFNDFFNSNFLAAIRGDVHPFRTDIKETADSYVIEAEMPGFAKEAINVEYDNNYLTITAKREAVNKEENANYIRQERHYGEFERRFFVENIDEDRIEATFKDGILTLVCPKRIITNPDRKRIEIH
jgi:HSP20 family protein